MDSIQNYTSNVKIAVTQKVILHMQRAFQAGSHKSQQLDTDRFEIRSVARSKVAIMIRGFYSISSKCGMCQFFTQQVT